MSVHDEMAESFEAWWATGGADLVRDVFTVPPAEGDRWWSGYDSVVFRRCIESGSLSGLRKAGLRKFIPEFRRANSTLDQ